LTVAEGIECPAVVAGVVAQNVKVVVVGPDCKTLIARPVPLVEDVSDLVGSVIGAGRKLETQWPLIRLIACVAFNLERQARLAPP